MGWMLFKQDPSEIGRADISDLDEDPVVVWQHKNYLSVAFFFGIVFPALVASTWGDWRGGLVYAGILRFFFVQQATFCINSLAHFLGEQPFDDRNSPRDNVVTALVTLGEGYHNFHHEFPSDYRKLPFLFPLLSIPSYEYDGSCLVESEQMLIEDPRQCDRMAPIRPHEMEHLPVVATRTHIQPQNLPLQRNRKRPPPTTTKETGPPPRAARLGHPARAAARHGVG